MKLFLSVATIILLVVLGTFPFQDAKSGALPETIELDSISAVNSPTLSGLLAIQTELSDLVNDLGWVIYENDIHYDFRLRIGEEISALQSELEEKMNTLAGLVTNFIPVKQRVDGLESLLEEFAEMDELAYYADKAYGRATDMRRAVEILIEELQAISDDLAQPPELSSEVPLPRKDTTLEWAGAEYFVLSLLLMSGVRDAVLNVKPPFDLDL